MKSCSRQLSYSYAVCIELRSALIHFSKIEENVVVSEVFLSENGRILVALLVDALRIPIHKGPMDAGTKGTAVMSIRFT